MAFCKNCGTRLEDDAAFCTNCGVAVADKEPKTDNAQTDNTQKDNAQTDNAQTDSTQTDAQPNGSNNTNNTNDNGWEQFCSTANDITAEVDPADANDNMIFGVFAYLFWLCLIPFFACKESKYCQFHAKQGMFLAVIETVVAVVFSLLGLVPFVGFVFKLIGSLLGLVCTFFAAVGIYNVIVGKTRELPIIGKYNFFK